MRIDRFLSECAVATRSESAKAIRRGAVTVDGKKVKSPAEHIEPGVSAVCFNGVPVQWKEFTYIMLNKPQGYISSTDDSGRTVMELLPPECRKKKMFPCGRLDRDTTGLLLVTNDGAGAHRLLSPVHHVKKTYYFECSVPVDGEKKDKLEAGVDIGEGIISAPAEVTLLTPLSGEISITEGKFHQVKRMLHAVGSEITVLKRIRFGNLVLDENLKPGEWRYLTPDEEKKLMLQ